MNMGECDRKIGGYIASNSCSEVGSETSFNSLSNWVFGCGDTVIIMLV
jgi:hypothetical protein